VNESQPKSRIEIARVMRAAASQTGDRSPDFAGAREIAFAVRTFVEKASRAFDEWKRQVVTTVFIANSKIGTGSAPFFAVRQDSTTSGAKLREQMRQLVSKRAINVRAGLAVNRNEIVVTQLRIQLNQFFAIIGAAGATLQSRIPFDAHFVCDLRSAVRTQKVARLLF
jgi:hypothetical protein